MGKVPGANINKIIAIIPTNFANIFKCSNNSIYLFREVICDNEDSFLHSASALKLLNLIHGSSVCETSRHCCSDSNVNSIAAGTSFGSLT